MASSETCSEARDIDDHSASTTASGLDVSGGSIESDPYEDDDPLAWMAEPQPYEDLAVLRAAQKHLPKLDIKLRPSQFTHLAFRMPKVDDIGYENFSFEGRRHIARIYDTPARRILLVCGRQTEKSTLLGNIALSYSAMVPSIKVLYVSPSAMQTKTFSKDRIKEPIETSPILKRFTTTALSQNVFEKQFINRSNITLRYAFLNADRTRGIRADKLLIDEIQDILSDNIPVIERTTDHANARWKGFIYSGTPKSLDNTIEWYRANRSTQGEWVVPCDSCGITSKAGPGRYWNILCEKNIGKKGAHLRELWQPDQRDA